MNIIRLLIRWRDNRSIVRFFIRQRDNMSIVRFLIRRRENGSVFLFFFVFLFRGNSETENTGAPVYTSETRCAVTRLMAGRQLTIHSADVCPVQIAEVTCTNVSRQCANASVGERPIIYRRNSTPLGECGPIESRARYVLFL